MSVEMDIIDSDAVGQYYAMPTSSALDSEIPYHRTIFSHEKCSWSFTKKAVLLSSNLASTEIKTQKIASRKIDGNVEAGGTYKWGGKDGGKITGYASGEIHDGNGNYARGAIIQNDDGTGSVTVFGGHKTEKFFRE